VFLTIAAFLVFLRPVRGYNDDRGTLFALLAQQNLNTIDQRGPTTGPRGPRMALCISQQSNKHNIYNKSLPSAVAKCKNDANVSAK